VRPNHLWQIITPSTSWTLLDSNLEQFKGISTMARSASWLRNFCFIQVRSIWRIGIWWWIGRRSLEGGGLCFIATLVWCGCIMAQGGPFLGNKTYMLTRLGDWKELLFKSVWVVSSRSGGGGAPGSYNVVKWVENATIKVGDYERANERIWTIDQVRV